MVKIHRDRARAIRVAVERIDRNRGEYRTKDKQDQLFAELIEKHHLKSWTKPAPDARSNRRTESLTVERYRQEIQSLARRDSPHNLGKGVTTQDIFTRGSDVLHDEFLSSIGLDPVSSESESEVDYEACDSKDDASETAANAGKPQPPEKNTERLPDADITSPEPSRQPVHVENSTQGIEVSHEKKRKDAEDAENHPTSTKVRKTKELATARPSHSSNGAPQNHPRASETPVWKTASTANDSSRRVNNGRVVQQVEVLRKKAKNSNTDAHVRIELKGLLKPGKSQHEGQIRSVNSSRKREYTTQVLANDDNQQREKSQKLDQTQAHEREALSNAREKQSQARMDDQKQNVQNVHHGSNDIERPSLDNVVDSIISDSKEHRAVEDHTSGPVNTLTTMEAPESLRRPPPLAEVVRFPDDEVEALSLDICRLIKSAAWRMIGEKHDKEKMRGLDWGTNSGQTLVLKRMFGEDWPQLSRRMVSAGEIMPWYLVAAYMGAATFDLAWLGPIPWKGPAEMLALSAIEERLANRHLSSSDPLLDIRNTMGLVAFRRFQEKDFQNQVIQPYANHLANIFMLTFDGFAKALSPKNPEPKFWDGVTNDMAEIFRNTFVLRGMLMATPSEFHLDWIQSGARMDMRAMIDGYGSGSTGEVSWCLTPLITRKRSPDSNWEIAGRAAVNLRVPSEK